MVRLHLLPQLTRPSLVWGMKAREGLCEAVLLVHCSASLSEFFPSFLRYDLERLLRRSPQCSQCCGLRAPVLLVAESSVGGLFSCFRCSGCSLITRLSQSSLSMYVSIYRSPVWCCWLPIAAINYYQREVPSSHRQDCDRDHSIQTCRIRRSTTCRRRSHAGIPKIEVRCA